MTTLRSLLLSCLASPKVDGDTVREDCARLSSLRGLTLTSLHLMSNEPVTDLDLEALKCTSTTPLSSQLWSHRQYSTGA